VRTTAPIAILRQRFQCEFTHIPVAFDFGMEMSCAVDVLADKSAAAYREFHADWDAKVQREAQAMRALSPDYCWPMFRICRCSRAARPDSCGRDVQSELADIYRHYCGRDAASGEIHAQMLAAYNSAACFLQLQPGMPMRDFRNTRRINPIAKSSRNRRVVIDAQLRWRRPKSWCWWPWGHGVSFADGGVAAHGGRALAGACAWGIEREDIDAFESLGLSFSDVLASCDAVLTKPGYGMFTEAACAVCRCCM